jgi:glycosyltransferase involved in cell wall biosynthesis
MKLLILLSTYNGSKYLPEFLYSLKMQTFQNWKLLIRDDGSIDDTAVIIQNFSLKYPNQVEITSNNGNIGAKASFSELIKIALKNSAWDYLMFADQDDVWMSDKIVRTRAKMESIIKEYTNEVPLLVHTDLQVVDSSLHVLSESFWTYQGVDPTRDGIQNQIIQNIVTGCTMMINRPLAQLAFPIPDEAIMHDWWISLVASAFGHIGVVSESTILYRQHNANDTGAKKFGWRHILERFHSRPTLDKYFIQAKAFFDCYGDQLNPSQQKMFKDLTEWEKVGFWKRRWLIIRYGLWKKGVIRNIGLMVFA